MVILWSVPENILQISHLIQKWTTKKDTAEIFIKAQIQFRLCRESRGCITDSFTLNWQRVPSGHIEKAPTKPLWILHRNHQSYLKPKKKKKKSASILSVCSEHNVNKYQVNTGWKSNKKDLGSLELAELCCNTVCPGGRGEKEGVYLFLYTSDSCQYGCWRQKEQWKYASLYVHELPVCVCMCVCVCVCVCVHLLARKLCIYVHEWVWRREGWEERQEVRASSKELL